MFNNYKRLICTVVTVTNINIALSAASSVVPDAPLVSDSKIYVVIDEKTPSGNIPESVSKAACELGVLLAPSELSLIPYEDADGTKYENVSSFPFIIMKGKKGKIGELLDSRVVSKIAHPEDGSWVSFVGNPEDLKPYTKKFSVLKPSETLDFTAPSLEEADDDDLSLLTLVDKEIEPGKQLNAIAHMNIGVSSIAQTIARRATERRAIISSNSENIRRVYEHLREIDSKPTLVASFLSTMHLGPTYREQIEATRILKSSEVKITGLCVGASTKVIRSLISLLR